MAHVNKSYYPLPNVVRIYYDDDKNKITRIVREKLNLSQREKDNIAQFYRQHIPKDVWYVEFDDKGFIRTYGNYITMKDEEGLWTIDVEE